MTTNKKSNTPVPPTPLPGDWEDPVRKKLDRKFKAGYQIPEHEITHPDDVATKQ